MSRRALFTLLMAAMLLVAATSAVEAARRGRRAKGPTGTFHGTITRLAGNTVQVNVGKKTEKNVTFWTSEKTSVRGGDKEGTTADLEVGQTVTVKASDGRAISIEVEVKQRDKDVKKGKPKDEKQS